MSMGPPEGPDFVLLHTLDWIYSLSEFVTADIYAITLCIHWRIAELSIYLKSSYLPI